MEHAKKLLTSVIELDYEALRSCISSTNEAIGNSAATAIRDLVLCDYPEIERLFNEKFLLEVFNHDDEWEKTEILGAGPVSFFTMGLGQAFVSEDIRKAKYSNYLEEKTKGEDLSNLVFLFNECALLGCFSDDEELVEEILDLDGIFGNNVNKVDRQANIRKKQLLIMLTSLPRVAVSGVDYYRKGMIEEARYAFLYGANKRDSICMLNLGYMLRRREVESVFIDEKAYSVDELLADSLEKGDIFSIFNKALLIYETENMTGFNETKYQAGLNYLKSLVKNDLDFQLLNVYKWWVSLAKRGDKEGYLVLLWLIDMGVTSDTDVGNREKIISLFL